MEQELDNQIFKDVTAHIEAEGLDIDELEEVSNSAEGFPYVVMMFAVSKDTTDTITAGLGSFFTTPLASLVIMLWMMGKGSFMKKQMRKWLVKRLFIWFIAKFFPLVNMAPLTSALVIMAHNRETEIVKAVDVLIETAYKHKNLGFKEIVNLINEQNAANDDGWDEYARAA